MQLSSMLLVGTLSFLSALPAVAAAQAAPEPLAPVRRDLAVRLDLGGTEPGTSRQAFEGMVAYRGVKDYELQAGYTYSDQVYFTSNRGYLTAYRFYGDGMSYVKGDASLRKYDYPSAPGALAPNPDANSYQWVPRGELEISHLLSRAWRVGAQYQLFPANFFHDPTSWTVNHKLSAGVEYRPVNEVILAGRAAVLRDPDPNATFIHETPGDPPTRVVYRETALIGGSAAVELRRVGLKVEYLPNRDLDNSYAWSILSTLDLRFTDRLDMRLQQVHDSYSTVSRFAGKTADIAMGVVGYTVNDALRLRAGYRYVDVPDRWGGTVIAGMEYRPGLSSRPTITVPPQRSGTST